ncbi:MAG: 16S rRNA (cytosine(1402)-N(4))-methyltransferase, partial [Clostridia bacterium]
LTDGGKIVAIDKDINALEASKKRLASYGDAITFVHDDFKNAIEVLDQLHIAKIDGVLLDLGVSSPQLDQTDRGFSY